jgi:hypothetical protein
MAKMTEKQAFYSDVIITAVESGIEYWNYVRKYRHGCTNKDIAKAFKLIMGKGEIPYASKEWRKRMVGAYWANDAGELDSGDADMVVQIGLLGKVVYG